ncbi:hypothetical protein [Mycoplasmopsis cynos]|uniref:hypothetical protein n=1 Tax=Mycoplasmopsis cynos TaxID=171284 RepID=UPI00220CDE9D|nr:hypothetical protein [Mycoplasmopsis cynos]UWV92022.1 hypothetical protein NWE57_03665 [Mycoplasmopsis cynos]
MANLFNNRENQNVEGFNPFVDNTPKSCFINCCNYCILNIRINNFFWYLFSCCKK